MKGIKKGQWWEQTKQIWQLPAKWDRNDSTSKWDNRTLRNMQDKSLPELYTNT